MIPDERPSPPAPAGHNLAPSPVDAVIAAQREAQTPAKSERIAYIVGKANAKAIVDRLTAGEAGDIIKVAREVEQALERDRIDLTKPYREAADAGKAECDRFLEPLRVAADTLAGRLEQWSAEEDKRIAEQAAEQDAFFAAQGPAKEIDPNDTSIQWETRQGRSEQRNGPDATAPPLKPARRSKIVGDLGARVTQAEIKHHRVTDIRAVPDFIMNSPTVHAAVIQVVRSMAKHLPTIPGIETTVGTGVRVK